MFWAEALATGNEPIYWLGALWSVTLELGSFVLYASAARKEKGWQAFLILGVFVSGLLLYGPTMYTSQHFQVEIKQEEQVDNVLADYNNRLTAQEKAKVVYEQAGAIGALREVTREETRLRNERAAYLSSRVKVAGSATTQKVSIVALFLSLVVFYVLGVMMVLSLFSKEKQGYVRPADILAEQLATKLAQKMAEEGGFKRGGWLSSFQGNKEHLQLLLDWDSYKGQAEKKLTLKQVIALSKELAKVIK